jgi:aspartate/methionine/tyrosine aminotransferase
MDSGMFYPVQKGAIAALKNNQSWFDLDECYIKATCTNREACREIRAAKHKEGVGLFV